MRYPILSLAFLMSCTPDPCGPANGRADDGECYPLALSGETDADSDSDSDSDSDTDTDNHHLSLQTLE